ncbi:MAG: tetratricopeptide repeat protein [Candidatus Acidiferrales bacterium]
MSRRDRARTDRASRKAVELDPESGEAHASRGLAVSLSKNFEEAGKTCIVKPQDYQAPTLLGTVYRSLGKTAEANAAARRALQMAEKHLELHPDDARALYLGAGNLAYNGERDRALEWVSRAWRWIPKNLPFFITLSASSLISAAPTRPSIVWKRLWRLRRGTGIGSGQRRIPISTLCATTRASRPL